MLRAVAVGDRVGRHAHRRPDRERLDVDLSHDAGDLIAAPLRPLRIGVAGHVGAAGLALEPRDRGRVIAPRWCARDVVVGIADAIEVDAVDVVAAHDARRDIDDPLRRVGVTGVEEPIGVQLLQAVGALCQPIGVADGGRAVGVEHVRRVGWGSVPAPDRRRDDPGVDLDPVGVCLVYQCLEGIERGGVEARLLGAGGRGAVAEAIATADDLGHDRVGVDGLRGRDDIVDLARRVHAVAERVDPIGPELALCDGGGGDRTAGLVKGGGRGRAWHREHHHEQRSDKRDHGLPHIWVTRG